MVNASGCIRREGGQLNRKRSVRAGETSSPRLTARTSDALVRQHAVDRMYRNPARAAEIMIDMLDRLERGR